MNALVKDVRAREVLDSRGNPTVEVDIIVGEKIYRADVPSGVSTGRYEAWELRDGGRRYCGKGVLNAVRNVNEIIAPKLIGLDCTHQQGIDNLMKDLDGTPNKERLGANSILAVSMAVAKAGAKSMELPLYKYIGGLADKRAEILPIPQMNVINGGRHADCENDIQEHLIVPVGAQSFKEALQICTEVYHKLKELLKERFKAVGIHLGDEGGFAPPLNNVYDRLEIITRAIKESSYSDKIALGLDSAASEFYHDSKYIISDKEYSSERLVDFYEGLIKKFNIVSIEDGMSEDDWEGYRLLNQRLGQKIQIIGDDLFVTNPERIEKGIKTEAANSLLLKVNQIGTVTETITAAQKAMNAGWTVVVSHRSGETEDTFIADLAVGLDAGFCKFGAPARTDRTAKYNQLLRIEEDLKERAKYGSVK